MSNKHTNGLWLNDKDFHSFAETKPPYGIHASRAKSIESRAFSNIIGALPNPDKVLQKQGKGIEAYRDLTYDAQVSSCIDSRKAGVLSLEWEFSRGAVKNYITEFVEKCFDNFSMYDVVSQILDASIYGYQVLESYFIPKNDMIELVNVVGKPQEWFCFNDENQLRFRTKENRSGEVVDMRKFTVATHKATYTNPYGDAVLSRCFWPVTFKKNGLKFWIRFAEKYGMPFLYGRIPIQYQSESATDELLDVLEGIIQDSVGVLPEGTEINLLEAGRGSTVDLYERLVKYFDGQISKAILSHSAGVDSTPGQLGNANQSILVRDDIVQADKRIVEMAINTIVANLVELNFGTSAEVPVFEMYEQDDIDMEVAQRDAVLVSSMHVQFTKAYIEKQYNLNDEDFEIMSPTSEPHQAPQAFNDPDDFADGADGSRTEQLVMDSAVNGIAESEAVGNAVNTLIQPIVDMINSHSDFSAIESKLAEIFPQMDSSELERTFERALFAADMVGRLATRKRINAK